MGAFAIKKLVRDSPSLSNEEERAVLKAINQIEKNSEPMKTKGSGRQRKKIGNGTKRKPAVRKPSSADMIQIDNLPKVSLAELEKILGSGIVQMQ